MRKPFPLILAAALSTACMPSTPSPNLSGPIECTLDSVTPLEAGGTVAVRMRLMNRSNEPVWFLRWNTPFEGWRGTIFTVTRGGAEIPFQGPMMKRGDPGAEEYVQIPAGQSVVGTADLSQIYDLGKPGLYELKVTGSLQDVVKGGTGVPRPRDQFQPLELKCGELMLDVKKARNAG
jgi:hypothetical protein